MFSGSLHVPEQVLISLIPVWNRIISLWCQWGLPRLQLSQRWLRPGCYLGMLLTNCFPFVEHLQARSNRSRRMGNLAKINIFPLFRQHHRLETRTLRWVCLSLVYSRAWAVVAVQCSHCTAGSEDRKLYQECFDVYHLLLSFKCTDCEWLQCLHDRTDVGNVRLATRATSKPVTQIRGSYKLHVLQSRFLNCVAKHWSTRQAGDLEVTVVSATAKKPGPIS